MPSRVLIVNGNTRAANVRIVSLGGAASGDGYAEALRHIEPDLDCTVLNAADGETLPPGVALTDFDGIAWTGSALSAYRDEPAVRGQIDLARQVFGSGVPCFGSCWGLQIMCAALGGEVRANPNGVEVGIARRIQLTAEGQAHPMYDGKGPAFDAIAIHRDDVATVPDGAIVLAANAMSRVQALAVETDGGRFWGVQYHPEFDLATIARLIRRDREDLIDQGLFRAGEDVQSLTTHFAELHDDPNRKDLAWRYGLDAAVLDPAHRMQELANWLRRDVLR